MSYPKSVSRVAARNRIRILFAALLFALVIPTELVALGLFQLAAPKVGRHLVRLVDHDHVPVALAQPFQQAVVARDLVGRPYELDTGLVPRSICFENPTGAPGEGGKEEFHHDGRVAFFARGRVKGKWLLTAAFDSLMPHRVHDILVVASSYDAFVLEEGGRLTELILNEYVSLNLTYAPSITRASSAEEALDLAWQTLAECFDPPELMMKQEFIERYYPGLEDHGTTDGAAD